MATKPSLHTAPPLQVVRHAPCDLITVKLTDVAPFETILMPTAGGPHAQLAAEYVGHMQKELGAQVTVVNVVPPGATGREREVALEWIEKTVTRTDLEGKVKMQIVEAEHVASGLVKAGSDHDLIVLGASREGIFSSVLLGEIAEKVARYSRRPVMIVKRYEGRVKSVVRKILG